MPDYDPVVRTRTLARIVGPYLAVMGAALVLRGNVAAQIVPAFMQDEALTLVTGAFTLMAGLVLLAAHHHWSSPAAIVISFIGVAATLKGAWLVLAPELGADLTTAMVNAPVALMAAAAFDFLIGLWLSYIGWFAKKGGA